MKKMKQFLSVLLAVVMMLAMSTAAFAGQEGSMDGGSITINNAVKGQTYSVYQILYLESYNPDSNAYVYKANSAWESWLKTQTSYVNIDEQGYVTWNTITNETAGHEDDDAAALEAANDAAVAAFAKAAQTEATKQGSAITADGTAIAPAPKEGQENSEVTFSELKLGYYLVDSTLGTLCSLDTTNPSVTIEEKNAVPTNEKEVQEDSTTNYGSVNDADIGDTVNFKSTITLPKGSENVVFHDKMSAGLTLTNNSLNTPDVKVYTDADMTTELAADNYTVTSSSLADDCTFEVSFDQNYLDKLTADSIVYVKYSATVNANAVVGNTGNPNTSKVSYGDESNTKTTPDSTTTTYTWSFDVLKYANGDESKVLADAQFVLLNKDKEKVAAIENGKLTGWANVPEAEANGTILWPENTILTTDVNGKIAIAGLDADTYYLSEIAAPAGYNKLSEDVEVKIEPTTADDGKSMTLTPVTAKVENKSGSELPSTGGMGTTIFYVLGGILVVGASILLITKKRMGAEK